MTPTIQFQNPVAIYPTNAPYNRSERIERFVMPTDPPGILIRNSTQVIAAPASPATKPARRFHSTATATAINPPVMIGGTAGLVRAQEPSGAKENPARISSSVHIGVGMKPPLDRGSSGVEGGAGSAALGAGSPSLTT